MTWQNKKIKLPNPKLKSGVSFEETLLKRRSHRAYTKKPLGIGEISQLLFAGEGVIEEERRTVPSAGAFYPIEIYLSVSRVKKISPGLYKYSPENHSLDKISNNNWRAKLAEAAFSQPWVKEAPALFILCGKFEKTVKKYDEKGAIFVAMEAGHVAQNISLQAAALNLGTLCVGGFNNKQIDRLLNLDKKTEPYYIIPVGKIFRNYQEKETEILNKFYKFLEKDFLKDIV